MEIMSIYISGLDFQIAADNPLFGPATWVTVSEMYVPSHIGARWNEDDPSDYEGDPFADYLPPPIEDENSETHRAVVFVHEFDHKKGQIYQDPLLIMSGTEYEKAPFWEILRCLTAEVQKRFGKFA